MEAKLYNQLFNKLDSLGAIRKDLTFGCEVIAYPNKGKNGGVRMRLDDGIVANYDDDYIDFNHKRNPLHDEIIGHPPVLTDCLKAINESSTYVIERINGIYDLAKKWDYNSPLLSEQSDELGEYLLTLLR